MLLRIDVPVPINSNSSSSPLIGRRSYVVSIDVVDIDNVRVCQ